MYPNAIWLRAEASSHSPPAAHLQDDGELLRGVAVLHAHGQPHLECRQLLRKEGTVLWVQEQEGRFGLKKKGKKKKM